MRETHVTNRVKNASCMHQVLKVKRVTFDLISDFNKVKTLIKCKISV